MADWKNIGAALLLTAALAYAEGCDNKPSASVNQEQNRRASDTLLTSIDSQMKELYVAAPFIKQVYKTDIVPELNACKDACKERIRTAGKSELAAFLKCAEIDELFRKYGRNYKIVPRLEFQTKGQSGHMADFSYTTTVVSETDRYIRERGYQLEFDINEPVYITGGSDMTVTLYGILPSLQPSWDYGFQSGAVQMSNGSLDLDKGLKISNSNEGLIKGVSLTIRISAYATGIAVCNPPSNFDGRDIRINIETKHGQLIIKP